MILIVSHTHHPFAYDIEYRAVAVHDYRFSNNKSINWKCQIFEKPFSGSSDGNSVMNSLGNKVAIKVTQLSSAQDGSEEQNVNVTTNQMYLMFQVNDYNVPPPNYNTEDLGSRAWAPCLLHYHFRHPSIFNIRASCI